MLELIDKTKEGKKVLDTLYLQAKLMGPHLDAAGLTSAIKFTEDMCSDDLKSGGRAANGAGHQCLNDQHKLQDAYIDFQARHQVLERKISNIHKEEAASHHLLQRSKEEGEGYSKFGSLIKINEENWDHFVKGAAAAFHKCMAIVHLIRGKVEQLSNEQAKQGTFVQLDNEYYSSLTEIRNEFDASEDEYQGYKPIIANLLEIMSNEKHVGKAHMILKIRECFHAICEELRKRREVIEDNNAVQETLAHALTKVYSHNHERCERIQKGLKYALSHFQHAVKHVEGYAKTAETFVHRARDIGYLRRTECQAWHYVRQREQIETSQILNYCGQVHEIVAENFHHTKAFFIQRDIKKNN